MSLCLAGEISTVFGKLYKLYTFFFNSVSTELSSGKCGGSFQFWGMVGCTGSEEFMYDSSAKGGMLFNFLA